MNFLSKDTQITQSGTALTINTLASTSLISLFAPSLGPSGTLKMLISSSLSVTKDGTTLCREIQFAHPFSLVVTRSALNLSQLLGDGTITFTLLTCEIFNTALTFKDTSLHKIAAGIQAVMQDLTKYLETIQISINEDSKVSKVDENNDNNLNNVNNTNNTDGKNNSLNNTLNSSNNKSSDSIDNNSKNSTSDGKDVYEKMVLSSLKTKIDDAHIFAPFITKAFKNIQHTQKNDTFLDTNMIELLKMPEGDTHESVFVEGLVLDHGPRHPQMPTELSECVILILSLSLEYEKPEINAQFNYKSSEQRDLLVASERKFIFERAETIAKFGKEIKKRMNKNLIVINEKGIDPISLEVLNNAKIPALRRAKRRNLERLVKMCGGNIVSRLDQLDYNNLGYCQKMRVVSFGDEKFTFLEGTPFQGSCTILVKGNTNFEVDRIVSAIKGSIKSLSLLSKEKKYLQGGVFLYSKIINYLNERIKIIPSENVVGYKVFVEAVRKVSRVLIRNLGRNVEEEEIKIERNIYEDEGIIDNFSVISRIFGNAC
ncbi:T-complex protein 1 subunit zeta, partial [Conglomerata obtusa]